MALKLEPGDLTVFSGHDGRHQHAINFMEHPITESKKRDVQAFYKVSRYSLRPSESYVNSDNSRIRRLISKSLELDSELMKGV